MIITPHTDHKMDIKFCLDKPENNQVIGSGFLISGWIIEKLGRVLSISIAIGNEYLFTFTKFYERPDVQSVYPEYCNSLNCGFKKFVSEIPAGEYELKIIATADGKPYHVLSTILKVLPPYNLEQVSQIMKNDWNKRAVDNAEKFVYNKGALIDDSEYEKLSNSEPVLAIELLKTAFPGVIPSNMTMLEIGSGIGRLAPQFSNLFRHYIGIDVSEEMVKIAKKSVCLPNVEFYTNNGIDLKMIKDRSEDFVFEAYVFQHVPAKNIVFNYCKETFRILKKGGYFMGLFWKNMIDKDLIKIEINKIQIDAYDGENVSITNDTIYGVQFNEAEIYDMLKDIGFVDIKFISNSLGKSPFLHHLVVSRKPN